jgi:hypothetical protein
MVQTPMTDGMPKGVGHIPQDHGQTFSPLFVRVAGV